MSYVYHPLKCIKLLNDWSSLSWTFYRQAKKCQKPKLRKKQRKQRSADAQQNRRSYRLWKTHKKTFKNGYLSKYFNYE